MGDSLVRQLHDLFVDVFFENATAQVGIYPIVTSQCISTALYQVSYHIQ